MAINTRNMNLEKVESGVSSTEDLIRIINQNADKIDAHSHISGEGERVPTSALFSNSDLKLRNYRLLDAKTLSFLSNPEDSLINNSLYFKNGELFARDGSGTPIQITSNGKLTSQVTVIDQTTALLYGYTANESTLSDTQSLAQSSAVTSFNIPGNLSLIHI